MTRLLHCFLFLMLHGALQAISCRLLKQSSAFSSLLHNISKASNTRQGNTTQDNTIQYNTMANAAAKKAAAAKEATANIYQPILIGTNLVYMMLLLGGIHPDWSFWNILGMIVNWALQAYAYIGILDRSKNAINSSSTSSKSKSLVGGAHLDLLGLTVAIQYGSVLHSSKWFWGLWIVPIWGGYLLYTTFMGGKGKKGNTSTGAAAAVPDEDDTSASNDKREKRAQKRRQKWG